MRYLILDDIRSAHNVGSIFRTADGAGVDRIFICGYTPAPRDRFDREVAEIQKTALGATKTVPWEVVPDILDVIDRLHGEGFSVVAVEQAARSLSVYDFRPPEKCAYVLGNEVEGINPNALKAADQIIEIPMRGRKESLNVSVVAGIVLFCAEAA